MQEIEENIDIIYCDEKGFSGQNLFNDSQQNFMYSSVLISPAKANELLNKARRDFQITDNEFKGSNLLKRSNGKQAIDFILANVSNNMYLMSMHKKYSLACKFFEYVFEPLISNESTLFYEIGFNRFIANILYFESAFGGDKPKTLLQNFQQYVREGVSDSMDVLFQPPYSTDDLEKFVPKLQLFCNLHKDKIVKEFNTVGDIPVLLKWLLDLTGTSLYRTLCYWGEKLDKLIVYCDSSKPLKEHPDLFNVMVKRIDKSRINFMGRSMPMTFNLAEPIKIVNSIDYAGIQIADCIASAAWYSVTEKDQVYSKKWEDLFVPPVLSDCCVFPDLNYMDLDKEECFVNTLIFNELVDRSVKGIPLLGGWGSFFIGAKKLFPTWLEQQKDIQ